MKAFFNIKYLGEYTYTGLMSTHSKLNPYETLLKFGNKTLNHGGKVLIKEEFDEKIEGKIA